MLILRKPKKIIQTSANSSYWDVNNKLQTVIVLWLPPFEPAFTYSKLTLETLEQGAKYVQS